MGLGPAVLEGHVILGPSVRGGQFNGGTSHPMTARSNCSTSAMSVHNSLSNLMQRTAYNHVMLLSTSLISTSHFSPLPENAVWKRD